ncbi:MAG: bifunctional phosphoribosylaminoimidazolecarboxamide formyltransferase/IMP cyclohydrolase [Oscillospiraceae bacterium]|nr:bifunctional phosphoribosylaminoimidazolecarboxamide formyltransferase/IMP cyclohydrolase [Oscillospiraceae bacterium]
MKKRALISTSDKTGIAEFAKILADLNYEIISTGGTQKALEEAGLDVTNISEVTGFPECLDGRVKTLDPKIHAGILAMRESPEHMEQLKNLNVKTIDMVVANLYPFKQTITKEPPVPLGEAIEQIDIGGPAMLRSAAKNRQDVVVVVDPKDYGLVAAQIKENGEVGKEMKLQLAYKVFEHTSAYDALIAEYLRKTSNSDKFPEKLTFTYEKAAEMRYGENPHQRGAFYKEIGGLSGSIASAVQLHGKEMSYLNYNDANGAIELLKEFSPDEPAAVAVKHATPCGVGTGETICRAYVNAYEADPVSIYGGIVALNQEVGEEAATEMAKTPLDIIIAPAYSEAAFEILAKKKNVRILRLENIAKPNTKDMYDMKKVPGGLLVQEFNADFIDESLLETVTKRPPSEDEMQKLLFAFKVVKHTKSNAIVLAQKNATTGIGPGQTNRVGALEIAAKYAGEKAAGSVMASDAFFPFSDCVELAHKIGVTAIIQPGGSIRDQDSIDMCDSCGISMVFTGIRHFKH